MKKHFVCLANSFKHGGRCIAGIEVFIDKNNQWEVVTKQDGTPQWIRPLSKETPTGEIPVKEAFDIPVLSIVRLEGVAQCPYVAQSENVYYEKMTVVENLDRYNCQILDNSLDLFHHTIFYNTGKSVTSDLFCHGDYSLMMIKIDEAVLYLDKSQEKKRPRLRFDYYGSKYDLPVTDPQIWEQLKVGTVKYGRFSNLYLVLSLGLEHEGYHHKLVTTIIEGSKTEEHKIEENTIIGNAWEFVEHTGRSIFLTGKAGTGKTTFLKTVVERSKKRMVVVAPTGVAAIHAGGVTIHSFFQLPFTPFIPYAQIKSKFDFGKEKRRIIASLDLLIIDEISMVRSDLLDAIDSVLRRFRDRYKPFGGVQLLMIGDLQQLTPVVTPEEETLLNKYYDTPYFFGSKALQQIDYVTIQLEKVYRQQDEIFLSVLNHIREGHPTAEDLTLLNSRYIPKFVPKDDDGYIRLTTHNHLANHYNESELAKLPSPSYCYRAEIKGSFPEYSYPTNELLELKEGAQVMFVKNDPTGNHRYYNGRIGRVVEIDEQRVSVLCSGDDEAIEVEPLEWENAQFTLNPETKEIETKVQGVFRQLPLRLAWAITIHKSQGLTFERTIIDANLSFAPGQVYVALSRCTTLEGIVLTAPIEKHAIINDQRVDDYISHQDEEAQKSIATSPQLKEEYYRYLLLELFDFHEILYREEYLLRQLSEFFYHSFTDIVELHKRVLADYTKKVMDVSSKWVAMIRQKSIEDLHKEEFLERVQRSADYFENVLGNLFTNPLELTKQVQSNNKQAMKRLSEILPELRQAILSRRYLMSKISQKGFSISSYLHEKQFSLLEAIDEQQIMKGRRERKANPPKEKKEKTWVISYQMYQQGMKPEEIAKERGFTIGTIYGHLAKYVSSGDILLSDILPPDHYDAIQKAIGLVGKDGGRTAIKDLCPPEVTYGEINLVLLAMEPPS